MVVIDDFYRFPCLIETIEPRIYFWLFFIFFLFHKIIVSFESFLEKWLSKQLILKKDRFVHDFCHFVVKFL